jgi:hypothetical protein
MKKRNYIRFSIIFLLPLTFIISQCFHKEKPAETVITDPRGATYAGSASCLSCHKYVYHDYLNNAHFKTSQPAYPGNVTGSFKPDSNTVVYNDSVKVLMLKHNDSIFQACYVKGQLANVQPFDIKFGFKRAETFLYWKDKYVYELPVTYYISLHKWANSPGYNDIFADFNRPIGEACFECHSSFIRQIPPDRNDIMHSRVGMEKASLILGIDCERCHGPGAQHVNFHTLHPTEKKPMYIAKVSSLTRTQRIDFCSECHSGINPIIWSTYDFKPGDKLSNYEDSRFNHQTKDSTKIDVHGNQVGLLTSSQCFIKGKIECSSCHSIHDNEVKSVKMYSQICTSCHSKANHNFCKMAPRVGQVINSNCIDCHMPFKSSNSIVIHAAGKQTNFPYIARMHRIAIYPEETKKVMAWLKANPQKQ